MQVPHPYQGRNGMITKNEWSQLTGAASDANEPLAIKKDEKKPRVDLIDPEFLEDLGYVLKSGAVKYNDHNWRNGFKWSRLIGACFRHLLAIMRGENNDLESGLPHTAHLSACVMFLSWHMKHKPELDDRWKS